MSTAIKTHALPAFHRITVPKTTAFPCTRRGRDCVVKTAQLRGRFGRSWAQAESTPQLTPLPVATLKSSLLDMLFETERGLKARGETKAKINELITQLEAQNPTPSPTSMMDLLSGSWKLIYTSNSELVAALALSRLPFVTIGDITQKIDGPSMTVENQVQISVPFSRTAFSTTASLEVRSPSRLQVKFEEGIIRTPELLEDVEIPSSVTVMGQTIDISSVASALKPLQTPLRDAVAQLGSLISQQPDLKIPIAGERTQTWLLTTFLDEDTRIMRGDRGSVYILMKDISIAQPLVEVIVEEPGKPETPLSIEYND